MLFGAGVLIPGQTSASYPSSLQSPDGKYFIDNSDDWRGAEPKHYLYLVNAKTLQQSLLYTYSRSVEVFLCPSSTCVVINDFEGSNVSSVYLINIDAERKKLDLEDLLLRWMKNHGEEKIASSCDHLYAYAFAITPEGDIRLTLTGYNG
jgi:hypothetical protein